MVIDRKMRRFALASLIALTAGILAAPTNAQSIRPAARSYGASQHAGTLEVPLNKSQVVNTDRIIAKAMIGNEEIADILPITDRSVYVLGKKMGTTSLTLYDMGGRVIAVMDIAVGPDIEALDRQLKELLPDENIQVRISNESVLLTGMVYSAGAADRAAQLAQAFAGDKVINMLMLGSSQQVMLEVRFAEVNRTAGTEIGMGGFLGSRDGTFGGAIGRGAQLVPGKDQTITTNIGGTTIETVLPGEPLLQLSSITDTFGIFRKQFGVGSLNIDAVLNALETRGMAKTLAQPTLLALSGERAYFLAGGEFPVPVAQNGAGTNGASSITVEFKSFGVSLAFTPTVLGDKTINLVVVPEVSAIDPSASFSVGNITIPGLRTRRASTTLELRDGESFAIAGLLSRDFQTTVDQVPLLGSIPILGSLFRSSGFKKGETELLIVVTPRLVAPITPAQVRLPTDRVADPTALETIFGEAYQPRALEPMPPASNLPQSAPPAGATGGAGAGLVPVPPLPAGVAPVNGASLGELPAIPGTATAAEDEYDY